MRNPTRAWAWASLGLAVGFAVLLALVMTGWGPLMSTDRSTAAELHRVAVDRPGWAHANRILTDWVWDPWAMRLLALAAVVFLVLKRARRLAWYVAVATAVGAGLQGAVKAAVGRERPSFPDPLDSASSSAFPSGHAMTAAIVCGLLLVVFSLLGPRRLMWTVAAWTVAGVSVLGVGFTRVFLGVHWMSDVLGGWILGGAVLAACAALIAPWLGTQARLGGERRPCGRGQRPAGRSRGNRVSSAEGDPFTGAGAAVSGDGGSSGGPQSRAS